MEIQRRGKTPFSTLEKKTLVYFEMLGFLILNGPYRTMVKTVNLSIFAC